MLDVKTYPRLKTYTGITSTGIPHKNEIPSLSDIRSNNIYAHTRTSHSVIEEQIQNKPRGHIKFSPRLISCDSL